MNDKDLYYEKMKAQLDEWKADIDKLKAMAAGFSADAKLKIHEHIQELEENIDEGKEKLAELTDASEDAWESLRDGMESAWETMKESMKDAKSKFKV